jgi:hypothetical protein
MEKRVTSGVARGSDALTPAGVNRLDVVDLGSGPPEDSSGT